MTHTHRGADVVARTLAGAGAAHVFTLSGNHIMPLFDALVDTDIDLCHARHEAAAVHMADAWARLTGQPGIALVTGGPGHGNAVSALYTALMAESPVVLLSGHAPTDQLGYGAFQEMRQAEMAAPVVKASWTCKDPGALGRDVARAIQTATTGRPGPVHLSLPFDALVGKTGADTVPALDAFRAHPIPLDSSEAIAILDWLTRASRPLVLTGPTCLTRDGRARLRALEEAVGIPAVGMESPRGSNDPSLGAFAEMLAHADRVLLIGKRMDFTLGFGREPTFAPSCEFVQIDAEALEVERARRCLGDRLVTSASADAFSAMTGLVVCASRHRHAHREWLTEVHAATRYRPADWDCVASRVPRTLHPVQVCRPLQTLLDSHPDSVMVSDGGEFGQWAQACLTAPNRVINGPAGAIGSALPMALAARMAKPEAPVITLMGDGTFGFHVAEIDTAVRYDLPFVAVVGNDARWNAEYQIQLRSYGQDRAVGCELLPTRYDLVAAAFGAYGEHVDEPGALLPAVERACHSGRPACVNVAIEGVPGPVVLRPNHG